MDASHPLRVTLGQIVIYCYNVDALACQGIEICRRSGDQGLSFTGFHLGNTPLMQNNASDKLHRIMLHVQCPSGRFPDNCKSLRENIIQSLPLCQAFLKDPGLIPKLFSRQLHHLRTHSHDLIYNRIY